MAYLKYTKTYLEELVKNSSCMWEVVEKSGMSKQEGNYRYLKSYINKYQISLEHFKNHKKSKTHKKTLSEWLVKGEHLTLSGNKLKDKLYKNNLKECKCELCGQDENWRGDKISLILDHIDGDRQNNELTNLRIVCPNCNATLPTHCGKNRKKLINDFKTKLITISKKEKNEIIRQLIIKSNIDFTQYGWGVKLGNILNKTPQYSIKWVRINMPELYKTCFKHIK
jgi:hypothetical protein